MVRFTLLGLLSSALIAVLPLLPGDASLRAQVRFLDEDPGTKVPIRLAAGLGPAKVRAGEFARVQVEVVIGAPWYIYALRPDPGGGPPSRMIIEESRVVGTGRFQESPPQEELDIATGSSVRVHKGHALFWTDVQVPYDEPPGPISIKGTFAYAACNGTICLPLRREDFVAKGTIEPGNSRQDTDRFPRERR